jgi:F-type H+-transporting ATPase subunit a
MDELTPVVVFEIFGIGITNTVVSTWLVMLVTLGLAYLLHKRQPIVLEMLVDFINDTVSDMMGRPALRQLSLIGTLFIFIAIANSIAVFPFISPPTSDINVPLALALVVFFSVHYFGIRTKGVRQYVRDLANPVFLFPFEVLSQLTRTISLTLRLFGNVLSIELIVAIVFSLVPLFIPLPLSGFGIFTGLLQAYIFTVLAAVYISAGLDVVEENGSNLNPPTNISPQKGR